MTNDKLIIEAYQTIVIERRCSADDILTDPALRSQFVSMVTKDNNSLTERYILKKLMYLRKKSRLPRSRPLIDPPIQASV